MSKSTNPNQPWRASVHAQSPAGQAKKKLRDASRRYLSGASTASTYREQHARLSAAILAGGLEMPDVALPPEE